jgi:zinc protease
MHWFVLLLLVGFYSKILADEPSPFAHEVYHVKPHPMAIFKTLKNGFRFVLLPNQTPEKRVLVYLRVDAGSLNETDEQQGIAHFLEHMAFNGTKNFPGESMGDFFKKIGMDFGGDTNAYTDFGETVYSLNLPDSSLMKEGISIMSDYAMHMLLTPEEIEKERGVILSEKRERDDIDFRVQYQNFQFALPGSLVAKRFPIGLEDSIKKFQRQNFVDFYTTWYRPENMVMIVVGDMDEKKWEKAIVKAFEDFKGKGVKLKSPLLKDVGHKGDKFHYYQENEATQTKIELSTVVIKEEEKKPYNQLIKIQLAESAATFIINQRLTELIAKKNSPLISANCSVEVWLKKIHSGSIEASCKPENWKEVLVIIENELRKILSYGFTDQEVALFKIETISHLENAVRSMSTLESQNYLDQILFSVSENLPFLDAKQYESIVKPLLGELTKEEVLKEFKKYWDCDHRLISVSGNVDIKDANIEIKKTYEVAKKVELKEKIDEVLIPFPFETKPNNPGKVISKEDFPEAGFVRLTFENHIVVNYKKTNFKDNQILFSIKIGRGAASAPSGKEAICHLASLLINEGGLEKLSKNELLKSLAGKNVSAYFSVEANCFVIQGETTPEDFELNLQLCRAILLNPGFRSEAEEVVSKSIDQIYKSFATDISAYFQNSMYEKISNGYQGLYVPERKILEAITISDMKNWLVQELKNSAIEINIVGDIEPDKVFEYVSVYFGSLPKRDKIKPYNFRDLALKNSFMKNEKFKTKVKKAIVFWMIPTVTYSQIDEVRQLNLLGKILEERTLKLIREKLGIAYSPYASHDFNDDYENFCYLSFYADIEPQNIDTTQKALESIVKEAYEKGINKADLESVRKPLLNKIQDYVKTNEYWLDRVLVNSVANPIKIKHASTFLKSYESITVDQVNAMIKKYLILDKKSVYILQAVPEDTK